MRTILSLLFTLALVGCGSWKFPGAYRIYVEQGNIVTEKMVGQLKPGMTRQQVRYILGTPLLEDSFNQDRWDYIYMLRQGDNTLRQELLTVHFEDDAMSHFTSTIEAAVVEEPEEEPEAEPEAEPEEEPEAKPGAEPEAEPESEPEI